MNIVKTIGNIIRKKRKKLGLSQSQLADLAGVSLNFVSQVENGKCSAQIDKVLELLFTLGIQVTLELGRQQIIDRVSNP